MKAVLNFLKQEKYIPVILAIIAIAITVQRLSLGAGGYNNYIIFKNSFFHLIHNKDLYISYPDEQNDIYLYSPAFALLMAPFVYLPMFLQLLLWCGLSSFMAYMVIKKLPVAKGGQKVLFLAIIFFELITTMQNMQTSCIIACLIIMGFICLENQRMAWAPLFILLAAFIKIYALAALVLFLMYPKRLTFIIATVFWGVVLLALPLVVISSGQLIFLYQHWYQLTVGVQQAEQTGINPNVISSVSLMTWMKVWFHFSPPIIYTQLAGTFITCLPLVLYKKYSSLRFRFFLLSSVLIWCMIFNHLAESASYIVAVMGIAVWFTAEDKNPFTITLLILAFVFTSLSPTDIFPDYVQKHFFEPYVLKAVPCILIWGFLQYRLLFKSDYGDNIPIPLSA